MPHASWPGVTRGVDPRDKPGDDGYGWLCRERQEAFVGGEDVGLHVVLDDRLLVERLHRAGERHPVQHLVLAGKFHFGERALAPGTPIAAADRVEEDAVAVVVGPQIAVLGA